MDSGNVNIVIGQSGSIAEGFVFGYLYQQGPDNFVDNLIPQQGTGLFKSQDSLIRAVCWSGPAGNYRAICSSVIFGALQDSLNTKNDLMLGYIDYLYKRKDLLP